MGPHRTGLGCSRSMYVKCRARDLRVLQRRESITRFTGIEDEFREQIAELGRGAHEVLTLRGAGEEAAARHAAARQGGLRSDGAGPASRAHRAAQQDAAVPAARPRGDLPHRRFHRDDRRPHRAQRHAARRSPRGDPGQRPDLQDAGVQDPRPRAHPHRLQLPLARPSCTAAEWCRLAAHYTVARMLERDDFSKRYKAGQPICDPRVPLSAGAGLRLGGACGPTSSWAAPTRSSTCWSGRALQEAYGQEPQVVMTLPLLEGHRRRQQDVEVARQLHRHHRGARQRCSAS